MAFVRAGLGFRGRARRRGVGAANCPSLSQLMGVDDPNDPCQQLSPSGDTWVPAATGGPVTGAPTCMPGDQLTVQNGYYICQAAAASGGFGGMLTWLKANPLAAVGLGAALLVVVVPAIGGGGRRR